MRRAVAALAFAVDLGGCGEEESGGSLSKADYEERFGEIARERLEFSEKGYDLGEVSDFP